MNFLSFLPTNGDDGKQPDCGCPPPAHPPSTIGEPTWLILAVAILPAVLPVVFERLGAEFFDYFKRKRIKKAQKKKAREIEEQERREENHGNDSTDNGE